MTRTTTPKMKLSGAEESTSENLRDLIRRDMARTDAEGFEALKAEVVRCFVVADDDYAPLDLETVIARNRPRATR